MQTISLGPNGPAVAPLGLGTWSWGDTLFWAYGKDFGPEEVEGAFHASLGAGVTLIDTAEIYGFGESERLIGRFCQETDQTVQIATKYFPLPWRWQRSDITKALTASLERLLTDSIALYQIHWPLEFWLKTPDFMAVLAAEVKKGRIQAVGVSNYSAQQMAIAHGCLAAQGIPLASNQVPYSLLNRDIESNGILAQARQLNVTILAYSPLAQGLLTGKYRPENSPSLQGARRLDPRFSTKGLQKLTPLLTLLDTLADKHDKTPAQIALNWLIAQGNVIPIPGAKNASQAKQNAGALGWQLNPEEIEQLRTVAQGV
ncbi:aldo/keto reductase [Synechocystis sp. LEGE 06083]|uniref:aldo/keto reductase n=1 Tax=Synechocystis sp. LEGE 06083 TaxID=915336 RepID=UPI001881C631|nr:aldo/keto reductase [Synechocystis sp. LEGE 06083]MBE9197471.1 aldo/keto reductase [Synechocystis sp. LEGE 06083]